MRFLSCILVVYRVIDKISRKNRKKLVYFQDYPDKKFGGNARVFPSHCCQNLSAFFRVCSNSVCVLCDKSADGCFLRIYIVVMSNLF